MPQYALPDASTFKVLKAALAAGVNLWNGADYYGTPDSNSLHLMNRYFTAYPEDADKVVFTLKSGIVNRETVEMDCSPAALRRFVDNANSILDGKKKIDVFGIGRVDPKVPVEVSVQALDELRNEGKFAAIELSEVRADTIRRASKVAKIDMIESEASLWSPEVFHNGVADVCAELGIVFVAHTPLGFGMLAGHIKCLDDLPADSMLRYLPRYQPDTFEINIKLVDAVARLAEQKKCTTAQLALSWLKAHSQNGGPFVVPIAGARSEERVRENARTIELIEIDRREINDIINSFPIEGHRTMPQAAARNEY